MASMLLRRVSRWSVALVLLAGCVRGADATSGDSTQPAATSQTSATETGLPSARDFARALLQETNRVRRANGRSALKRRTELEAAADDQAAFMALRLQVQHESFLRGQATPFDRVQRRGLYIESGAVAENVASTTLGDKLENCTAEKIAAMLVQQWMNSPGHRATLLDPKVTHFGGAVRLARTVGGAGWAAYGAQLFVIARPAFGRVSA